MTSTRSLGRRSPLLTAYEEVELAKQIEAGLFAKHLLKARSPIATQEDLQDIASQGDKAFELMIRSNLRLVPFVARTYLGQGLDMEELIQEGIVGLVIAIQKFDYCRGIKFSSHAVWWIRYALTTGTANTGRAIRVPREVHAGINRFRRLQAERAAAGMQMSINDAVEVLGLPSNRVAELEKLSKPISSIDAVRVNGRKSDWIEVYTDIHSPSALDVFLTQELCRTISEALAALNSVEMRYLELLYGVDNGRPRSKGWVRKELGLQPTEASAIHAKVKRVMENARVGELAAIV
jgi:RNA polymerase nonessential primary-like sigma factor